jgi:hypothetical protein
MSIDHGRGGTRALTALLLVVSLAVLGPVPARADEPPARSGSASDDEAPRPVDPSGAPGPSSPRLQADDERPDGSLLKQGRSGNAVEAEERPFWKNWIFWAVTGALVVAGTGLAIYSLSGSEASLDPCPTDVALSLGCYGSGRGR